MSIDFNSVEVVEDVVDDNNEDVVSEEKIEIEIGSPEWTDYVLSLLRDKEKVDGYPKVVGLRRLARKLIGDIVTSKPTFIQGMTDTGKPCATVGYTIVFVDVEGNTAEYGAVADAGSHNVDYMFAKYPSAIAETRAEGRTLRKALQLDIVTAEELDEKTAQVNSSPVEQQDKYINDNQKNSINIMCMRNNINVRNFVNNTLDKVYDSIRQVEYSEAGVLVKKLTEYQRDKTLIPENILGFTERFE